MTITDHNIDLAAVKAQPPEKISSSIDFERLTGDEILTLVNALVRKKDWNRAEALLHSVRKGSLPGREKVLDSWISEHVTRQHGLQDRFREVFLKDPAGQAMHRLGLAGMVNRGSKPPCIHTQPVFGGKVCTYLFYHCLTFQDGRVLELIEKVYSRDFQDQVHREKLLFQEMDHRSLCAPRLFFSCFHEGFHSFFYAWITGCRPGPHQWKGVREQLLTRLWHTPPTAQLLELTPVNDSMTILKRRLKAWKEQKNPILSHPFWQHLVSQEDEIQARYEGLPRFIMHEDLCRSNVICSPHNGRFLIDWDKWSIEAVGAGLKISRAEIDSAPKGIVPLCAQTMQGVREADFLFSALLYNLTRRLKKGELQEACRIAESPLGAYLNPFN